MIFESLFKIISETLFFTIFSGITSSLLQKIFKQEQPKSSNSAKTLALNGAKGLSVREIFIRMYDWLILHKIAVLAAVITCVTVIIIIRYLLDRFQFSLKKSKKYK